MKNYQAPELELIRFTAEDLICASAKLPDPGVNETPIVPFPKG